MHLFRKKAKRTKITEEGDAENSRTALEEPAVVDPSVLEVVPDAGDEKCLLGRCGVGKGK